MSVSRTSNKPLVLSMALMVLLALVIPFAGTALATHPGNRTTAVDLQPDQDIAAVGTCNEFTVVATGQNDRPAEGETVNITIAQQDQDTLQDNRIGFCDPDGAAPGTAAGGRHDLDDNPVFDDNLNPQNPPAAGVENPARATGQCLTGPVDDNPATAPAGTCTFGIESNEPGQTAVRACIQETDQFGVVTEICDQSLKTWVAGGPAAVTNLDCEPEADQNPEVTEHIIRCTATGANGVAIAGIQVQARVTAGPNNNTVLTCGQITRNDQGVITARTPGTTNNQGQVECWYTDANDGDVGTDTIIGFVDQPAPAGGTATAGQPDAHEPQDQVTKTWFGPGRVINCEPETATNASGTQHVITCTVTDREGQPVVGEQVAFFEEGPGRFAQGGTPTGAPGATTTTATTNAQGVATVTVTTFENEEGIQEVTGSLNQARTTPTVPTECQRAANDPRQGNVAGVCADTVVKNWARGQVQPPTECSDGLDNDGDGLVDMQDPDCASPQDDNEGPSEIQPRGACRGFPIGSRTPKPDGSGVVIVGTQAGEILVGTDGDDTICALGGDDQVDALEGNDQVFGGAGDDEIDGGGGRDQLSGQAGDDSISGRRGHDTIFGGGGNDVLKGNRGIDGIRGGDGADILQGGQGEDTLYGGDGDDTLRGWTQDDVLYGGEGNDTLNGHAGFDVCRGGPGRDIIRNCERTTNRRA